MNEKNELIKSAKSSKKYKILLEKFPDAKLVNVNLNDKKDK